MTEKDSRKREVKCTGCGTIIQFDMPQHEVINAETVSLVVMAHPPVYTCTCCGQQYVFIIRSLKQVEYGLQPLKKSGLPQEEEEHKIWTPPKKISVQ